MLGPLLDRRVSAGVPRHRQRLRRPADRGPADAVGVSVRLRVHDALARRALRCAGPPAGRARGPRDLSRSRRWAARSPATSRRCGCSARCRASARAAGIVVGRAIIRDRFHGADAQRLMSQITLVFGIAPGDRAGARRRAAQHARLALDLLGAAGLVRSRCWPGRCEALPETLPAQRAPVACPAQLWRNYVSVLRHREFLLLGAIPALNFAAFFLYIASAPSFLIDLLGVSSYGFAWLFVPMITGIMIGASISGRAAGRCRPRARSPRLRADVRGVAIDLGVAWLVAPGVPWHVLPIMIYTMGSSVIMPTVTLLLLDLFPTMRGLASSLQGFLHFVLAAVNAGTIAPLLARSLQALALGMVGFTVREPRAVARLSAPHARHAQALTPSDDARTSDSSRAAADRAGLRRQLRVAAELADDRAHDRQPSSSSRKSRPRPDTRTDRPDAPLQPSARSRHAVRVRRAAAARVLDEEHLRAAVDRVHRRRRPHPQHRGHGTANRRHASLARAGAVRARDEKGLVRANAASHAGDRVEGLDKAPKARE